MLYLESYDRINLLVSYFFDTVDYSVFEINIAKHEKHCEVNLKKDIFGARG